MLQRVSIDGHHSNRCSPLMMSLVDVLVEERVVEKPIKM